MADCSLIISTYNRPDALEICLQSILQQTVQPGEVLIADDGSASVTAELIDKYRKIFPVPLIHIWHEDEGFQLAKIRNKSVASARYNYIIQLDGDIFISSHFIKDHLEFARKNHLVRGSRISLDEKTTNEILYERKIPSLSYFRKKPAYMARIWRIGFLSELCRNNYKTGGRQRFIIKGCNMAFWKEDFIKVNGYNEAFEGWGYEDVELCVRMLNAGIKKQSLKFRGIAFHLYHPFFSRENKDKNYNRLRAAIAGNTRYCRKGINQYLPFIINQNRQ